MACAPRERESQLPYLSPAAAHTLLRFEDARDQIALDRGVFCEERNECSTSFREEAVSKSLITCSTVVIGSCVMVSLTAPTGRVHQQAHTARPMRSTRATITLSHRACNARASSERNAHVPGG